MLFKWVLPIAVVANLFTASESRAGQAPEGPTCEASLSGELSRPPNEFGLITDKAELNLPNMIFAYEHGIFPWGQSGQETAEWFNPWERGILELDKVHIGRRDRVIMRKLEQSNEYEVTFDQAFSKVILECAYQERWTIDKNSGIRYRSQPWLTELFIRRYLELHQAGYAHSVEVWRNGELVAGLYGVFVNGMFSGESMFHHPVLGKDATKLALKALIDRLIANGHKMIDTQQAKGLALKWGAVLVKRPEYMHRLKEAQARNRPY